MVILRMNKIPQIFRWTESMEMDTNLLGDVKENSDHWSPFQNMIRPSATPV